MTELLERAVAEARKLPVETQDQIARAMLAIAQDPDVAYELTSYELASMEKSLRQAEHGEFASDDEVDAIWKKYDLEAP